MFDKRLTTRLMVYWERLKGDNIFPDIRKHNPASIEDLWQYCIVISVVQSDLGQYKYEFMGEQVVGIYGKDLTGTTVNLQVKQFPNSAIALKLGEVLATQNPQQSEGQFPGNKGKMIKYRACLLPFGTPAEGMTHIVVGLSFREF